MHDEIKKFEKAHNVKRLLKILVHGKDQLQREEVTVALGRLRNRKAVGPLLKILDNPKGPQVQVIWSLGMIGDEKSIKPLIRILVKFEKLKRAYRVPEIITALGRINSVKSVPLLLDIVRDIKSGPRLRQVAIGLVGRTGDTRAVPLLIELLKTDYRWKRGTLRYCLLFALSDIRDPRVIEPLLEILPKTDKDFQEEIINVLPKFGKSIEKYLKQLSIDKNPLIRRISRRALKVL